MSVASQQPLTESKTQSAINLDVRRIYDELDAGLREVNSRNSSNAHKKPQLFFRKARHIERVDFMQVQQELCNNRRWCNPMKLVGPHKARITVTYDAGKEKSWSAHFTRIEAPGLSWTPPDSKKVLNVIKSILSVRPLGRHVRIDVGEEGSLEALAPRIRQGMIGTNLLMKLNAL
ncbi:MAG: hypothetical protein AB7H77_05145 [Bdellovibrionales bacterium]